MSSAIAVVLAVLTMSLPSAQESAFEVASVKVARTTNADTPRSMFFYPGQGQVSIHAYPLRAFLPPAFDVPLQLGKVKFDFSRVSRDLVERTYFDIQAKGDPAGDLSAMMRTLLRDRFGLKWHSETRTVPLYTLTVTQSGKLGPWLKATTVNCLELARNQNYAAPECKGYSERSRFGRQARSAGTIAHLVTRLQEFADLPLIDSTGLTGNYAWDFAMPVIPPSSGAEKVSAFRDALKDDLGLTLTRTKGPWEVIVIDDVRMPTPN